ncbi:MAG: polysaccharide export protein [Acaryochloridaceae cyanobacterium SU_2_1]|nr:polysaccharide export protein [Acaryochloridaceae cyanobacterium SU_2_1]
MFKLTQGWVYSLLSVISVLVAALPSVALPLSPGDRLEVTIPNEKHFSRIYEVNQEGNLEVPYLGDLAVAGLEPLDAEQKLTRALVTAGYFPPQALKLSLKVVLWAPVEVGISGEVFLPGRVTINESAKEERPVDIVGNDSKLILGDYPPRRSLTKAISAAGGVTPTADISKVRIIRGQLEKVIDLTGVFSGGAVENISLVAGDQVIIPTADRFQPELVRPSEITLPGIKIFVSNLTIPADSNNLSAIRNEQEGISFPYGGRFSQAVVATNCVGGTKATNADRKAILMRVDRLTGKTTYLERPVEDLIRNSYTEAENPLLMPRDAVACYDSRLTNTRDVFRSITDIFTPAKLLLDLFF